MGRRKLFDFQGTDPHGALLERTLESARPQARLSGDDGYRRIEPIASEPGPAADVGVLHLNPPRRSKCVQLRHGGAQRADSSGALPMRLDRAANLPPPGLLIDSATRGRENARSHRAPNIRPCDYTNCHGLRTREPLGMLWGATCCQASN
jgi:hypothetical protein